jgi:hypothetical protein
MTAGDRGHGPSGAGDGGPATPTVLVVIRRDRPDLSPALAQLAADESIRLVTDRRQVERRANAPGGTNPLPPHGERRQARRRRPASDAWDALGFVIVPASPPAPGGPP